MDADLAACRPLAATAEERWRNGYGDRGRDVATVRRVLGRADIPASHHHTRPAMVARE